MNNLYYIEYKFDGALGQSYFIDTGFGILDLGTIENNEIFDNEENLIFSDGVTLEKYLERYAGEILSYSKVL